MSALGDATKHPWRTADGVKPTRAEGALRVDNPNDGAARVFLEEPLTARLHEGGALRLRVRAELTGRGTACLIVRFGDDEPLLVPIDSESELRIPAGAEALVGVEVEAKTAVRITQLSIDVAKQGSLATDHLADGEAVLVTAAYPTPARPFEGVLAHRRAVAWRQAGFAATAVCVDERHAFETVYEYEGVKVYRGKAADLARVLSERRYSRILLHSFDAGIGLALERALLNRQSPVVVWRGAADPLDASVVAPFFIPVDAPPPVTLPRPGRTLEQALRLVEEARRPSWIFTSEVAKQATEALAGVPLRAARVVPNPVGGAPVAAKPADARKRLLVIGGFDNERREGMDLAVHAILELARRPLFSDLRVDVVGDGHSFDEFTSPLKRFPNVVLHRERPSAAGVAAYLDEAGIALMPTRTGAAQGLALEAAAAGVVIVTNRRGDVPEYFPESFGTVAASDDPVALADAVARLYDDPERFHAASAGLAAHVRDTCSSASVIERELETIRSASPAPTRTYRGSPDPLLSVIVPLYNMQVPLERCLGTLLEGSAAGRAEIVVIDDGSTDRSLEVARRFEAESGGVIRVVAKPNGGHGSVINRGLQEARGRYFRIVDSDDWVDSGAFAEFLRRLESEDVDVVLTDYSEDWTDRSQFIPKRIYANVIPGLRYDFETLTDPHFGFQGFGPVLSTSTYRTERLREAGLRLDEGIAYVDMEYNALALHRIQTVRHYDLDIYRYYLGRSGQTVSRSGFTKKYKHHETVTLRICDYVAEQPELSDGKRSYIVRKLLVPLIDAQFFIIREYLQDAEEFRRFDQKLERYPFLQGMHFKEREAAPRWGALAEAAFDTLKPALPYFFVASVGKDLLASRSRMLKHTMKFFLPYGIVKKYKGAG